MRPPKTCCLRTLGRVAWTSKGWASWACRLHPHHRPTKHLPTRSTHNTRNNITPIRLRLSSPNRNTRHLDGKARTPSPPGSPLRITTRHPQRLPSTGRRSPPHSRSRPTPGHNSPHLHPIGNTLCLLHTCTCLPTSRRWPTTILTAHTIIPLLLHSRHTHSHHSHNTTPLPLMQFPRKKKRSLLPGWITSRRVLQDRRQQPLQQSLFLSTTIRSMRRWTSVISGTSTP